MPSSSTDDFIRLFYTIQYIILYCTGIDIQSCNRNITSITILYGGIVFAHIIGGIYTCLSKERDIALKQLSICASFYVVKLLIIYIFTELAVLKYCLFATKLTGSLQIIHIHHQTWPSLHGKHETTQLLFELLAESPNVGDLLPLDTSIILFYCGLCCRHFCCCVCVRSSAASHIHDHWSDGRACIAHAVAGH